MSRWIVDEEIQRLPSEDRALVKAMMDYGRAFMLGASVKELWPLHRVWERELRRRWPERGRSQGILTMPRSHR